MATITTPEAPDGDAQVVIALTEHQAEFVRGLLYQARTVHENDAQADFIDTITDQFEQALGED